jgi:hypothetical protein
METICCSETSVDIYRATRCYNPENLKSKVSYISSEYDEVALVSIVSIKLDSKFRQVMRPDIEQVRYIEL